MTKYNLRLSLDQPSFKRKAYDFLDNLRAHQICIREIQNKLSEIGRPVPPIETYNHHRCHAASVLYPADFDDGLIITLDGRGERDSTVIWQAEGDQLERIRTYKFPNSLGGFYGAITVYLGYILNNGEGKIMGLAPYGSPNEDIEEKLRNIIETGVDYDVSALNYHADQAIPTLEELFDRPKKNRGGTFSQWEKDLAYVTQQLLEEIVVDIVDHYCDELAVDNVGITGGVALNCKMNKRIMELDSVHKLSIQPVANDAGTAIGAGFLENSNSGDSWNGTVYWGPDYQNSEIKRILDECKLSYDQPDNLERSVARKMANGELIGWFQGRLEMGPRALGNRSILADSRFIESRDRVNKFVKHREEWRPFAPSMLESAIDEYLVNAEPAPYMIKTFDVKEDKLDKIPAVIHNGDNTTRPQTVNEEQNPRYHRLISEFEDITGVPVILNTSFNDHGEPIVNNPTEAIKDFFGMGLDVLVLEDLVIEKTNN